MPCSSVTSLESTLARQSVNVDSKPLTSSLSSLDATFTKNRGRGSSASSTRSPDCCRFKMSSRSLLRFGGCGTALEFRRSIEFRLGSVHGFHLFVQLSQLIVRCRIFRREFDRFLEQRNRFARTRLLHQQTSQV